MSSPVCSISGNQNALLSEKEVDLNAEHYIHHSNLQHTLAGDLLNRVELSAKKMAVDIGCGDGSITAEIAKQMLQGKIVGVDASESMISLAKKTFSRELSDYKNLDFHMSKAENFRLPEGVDLVTSFSCFHWIREPEKALNQICRSIVPGGELLILTYVISDYYRFLQDVLDEYYPEYKDTSAYKTMFPPDGYEKVLRNNRMKIQEFNLKPSIAAHDNESAMKEFIRGWLTSFVPLPENLHEQFLNRALERSRFYRIPVSGDEINLRYNALVIRAMKE